MVAADALLVNSSLHMYFGDQASSDLHQLLDEPFVVQQSHSSIICGVGGCCDGASISNA